MQAPAGLGRRGAWGTMRHGVVTQKTQTRPRSPGHIVRLRFKNHISKQGVFPVNSVNLIGDLRRDNLTATMGDEWIPSRPPSSLCNSWQPCEYPGPVFRVNERLNRTKCVTSFHSRHSRRGSVALKVKFQIFLLKWLNFKFSYSSSKRSTSFRIRSPSL